jgi:hypothetical protein
MTGYRLSLPDSALDHLMDEIATYGTKESSSSPAAPNR